MNWKFWEKKGEGTQVKKLPRPKELPSSVGRFLMVNLKQDPDWVWSLRCVVRQREGKKTAPADILSETSVKSRSHGGVFPDAPCKASCRKPGGRAPWRWNAICCPLPGCPATIR